MSFVMVSSIISTLGTIAGSVASILAVLVVIFRPVRNAIIRLFSDIDAKKKLYASVENAISGIHRQREVTDGMNSVIADIRKEEGRTKQILSEMNTLVKEMMATDGKHSGDISLLKAHALCTARDSLTRIYDAAMKTGGISDYQKQNFIALYDVYCNLGGNSYVHQIHDEILGLPRIK